MNEIDRQIRERVDAFVRELSELVRRSAVDAVRSALGEGLLSQPARSAEPRRRESAPRAARAKGEKRSPDEIARATRQLQEFITANPGRGVEDIARALGTVTRELNLSIRKLLAANVIRTEGQKRATKYFPARGGAAPAAKATAPAARASGKAKKGGRRARG